MQTAPGVSALAARVGPVFRKLFLAEMVTAAVIDPARAPQAGGMRVRLEDTESGPPRHFLHRVARFAPERGENPIARGLMRMPFAPVIAARRVELVHDEHWRDSYLYWDAHVALGLDDVMVALLRSGTGSGVVSVSVLRSRGGEPFSPNDLSRFRTLVALTSGMLDAAVRASAELPGPGAGEDQGAARARWEKGMRTLRGASLDVLVPLLNGRKEREIARAIHRSPHTVHSHVRKIYMAMGVGSRVELVSLYHLGGAPGWSGRP